MFNVITALGISLSSGQSEPSSSDELPKTFPTLDDFVKKPTQRPNYLADLPAVMKLWCGYNKKLDAGKESVATVKEIEDLISFIDLTKPIRDQEDAIFKKVDALSKKSVANAFVQFEDQWQRTDLLNYQGIGSQVNLKEKLDSRASKLNTLLYLLAKKGDSKHFAIFINFVRIDIRQTNADIQRFGLLKIRKIYSKKNPDFTKERNPEILKFLFENISDQDYADVFWYAEGAWHYELASDKDDVKQMLGEVKYAKLPLQIQHNIAYDDTRDHSPESVKKNLPTLLRNDGSFYDILIRDYANIKIPKEEIKK